METTTHYAIGAFMARITGLQIVPNYEIKTAEEYAAVNAQMQELHQIARDVERARKAELEPLKALVDEVRSRYLPVEDMCAEFKQAAQLALSRYARLEADRIASERAEADRKHALARAAAEQKAREERAAAAAKALELAEAGKTERAEAVLAAAEQKATLRIEAAQLTAHPLPVATKLEGSRSTERWTVGPVKDMRAALRSLVADESVDLSELVSFKQAGLNKLAAVFKDNLDTKYPGLVATKQIVISATGR